MTLTGSGLVTYDALQLLESNQSHTAGRKCGMISAVTLEHSCAVAVSTRATWISFHSKSELLQLTPSPLKPNGKVSSCFASNTNASSMTNLPSPRVTGWPFESTVERPCSLARSAGCGGPVLP